MKAQQSCSIVLPFVLTMLKLRAGSHYAQVERRSVTFVDQTMSRGEAFGLKKYIKIIHLKNMVITF